MARKTLNLNEVVKIAEMIENNKSIKEIAAEVGVSIPFMYNVMNMNSSLYEMIEMIIEDIQNGLSKDDIILKYRNIPLTSYKKMKEGLKRLKKAKNISKYELIVGDKKIIITGTNIDVKIRNI